ncbi:MAG: RNA 2',3'-cyclic phosphodiesterase [Bacteroidales bacterium]
MKRLFCAVKVTPSQAVRDTLEAFHQELQGEKISWVSPDNLHLTLKFFGDTPGYMQKKITPALQNAAAECSAFSFRMEGCGTFGNPRMPRVLWLGIKDADDLDHLYQSVNRQLEPLGYKPDKATFVPHLTIGRIKHLDDTAPLRELMAQYESTFLGTIEVNAFYLIQSILRPKGPEYKILDEFSL